VRPERSEEFLQPSEGVSIEDRSLEFGPEALELSILGLDAEIYSRFFPHHVKTYEAQFHSE
jgi:hypothetical protein